MYQRLKASLIQPKHLFKYQNDRKRIVFLYMSILILIAMLPYLVIQGTQGSIDNYTTLRLEDAFQSSLMNKNNYISDGMLTINEPFETLVDFNVYTSDPSMQTFYLVVGFSDTSIMLLLGGEVIEEVSYEDVLPNFDFRDASIANTSQLVFVVKTFLNQSTWMSALVLGSILFSIIIDYVIITLLMVTFMHVSRRHIDIPFAKKLKIGFYMSTPYIVSTLLFILYGLGSLSFIAMFVVYVYYIIAYKREGGLRAQV